MSTRRPPRALNAQAQGFLFLLTFGLGLIIGNYLNGKLLEHYKTSPNGAV